MRGWEGRVMVIVGCEGASTWSRYQRETENGARDGICIRRAETKKDGADADRGQTLTWKRM